MFVRSALIFLFVLATGCASAPPTSVIDRQYRAIERGELVEWANEYSADAFLFGTDPDEAYVGRDAILASVSKGASGRMKPTVTRTYRSKPGSRRTGFAADKKSAWVADEIEYTVTSTSSTRTLAFRMTSLIADNGEGKWEILASCYSVPVLDEDAFAMKHEALAPIEDHIAPGAEPIAELARTMKPDHFAGDFSDRSDVFLFGTSPKERVEGGDAVQKFTRQGQPESAIRIARTSGILAALSPAKNSGYLAYNAAISIPEHPALPVRVMAVFVEEQGTWLKVQEHVSVAVPD